MVDIDQLNRPRDGTLVDHCGVSDSHGLSAAKIR